MTIADLVRWPFYHDAAKHELADRDGWSVDDYVVAQINALTLNELLERISDAIAEQQEHNR